MKNFNQYHRKNPHIWNEFQRLTLALIARGVKHYSARTIIHYIRMNTQLKENNSSFKINDHISPYYARKFMQEHPEHDGFFKVRRSRVDELVKTA